MSKINTVTGIFLSRMVKAGADKEKDFKEIIVKYLTDQNRPYSVNDLVANLHNQIPKTGIFILLLQ